MVKLKVLLVEMKKRLFFVLLFQLFLIYSVEAQIWTESPKNIDFSNGLFTQPNLSQDVITSNSVKSITSYSSQKTRRRNNNIGNELLVDSLVFNKEGKPLYYYYQHAFNKQKLFRSVEVVNDYFYYEFEYNKSHDLISYIKYSSELYQPSKSIEKVEFTYEFEKNIKQQLTEITTYPKGYTYRKKVYKNDTSVFTININYDSLDNISCDFAGDSIYVFDFGIDSLIKYHDSDLRYTSAAYTYNSIGRVVKIETATGRVNPPGLGRCWFFYKPNDTINYYYYDTFGNVKYIESFLRSGEKLGVRYWHWTYNDFGLPLTLKRDNYEGEIIYKYKYFE